MFGTVATGCALDFLTLESVVPPFQVVMPLPSQTTAFSPNDYLGPGVLMSVVVIVMSTCIYIRRGRQPTHIPVPLPEIPGESASVESSFETRMAVSTRVDFNPMSEISKRPREEENVSVGPGAAQTKRTSRREEDESNPTDDSMGQGSGEGRDLGGGDSGGDGGGGKGGGEGKDLG